MKTRSDAKNTNDATKQTKLKLPKNGQTKKTPLKNTFTEDKTKQTKHRSPSVESRLKTPKHKKTPGQDDFVLSQQFDSQTDVGWDCNSPDNFRHLQKLSHREGDQSIPVSDIVLELIGVESNSEETQRGTPPLLGLWRENKSESENISQLSNTLLDRPKRKGRCRRKSAKDSLLEKLKSALGQCSETKEPDARDVEGDILPVVSEEEFEEGKTAHNVSGDLFASTSENIVKHDAVQSAGRIKPVATNTRKSSPATSDISWSDEEFFEEDSFIIKATQFPEDIKDLNSPVLGSKRKLSNDTYPQKSKCSRYTFQVNSNTGVSKTVKATVASNKVTASFTRTSCKGFGVSTALVPAGSLTSTTTSLNRGGLLGSDRGTHCNKNNVGTFSVACAQPGSSGIQPSSGAATRSSVDHSASSVNKNNCVTSRAVNNTKCTSSVQKSGVLSLNPNCATTNQKGSRPSDSKTSSFRKHSSFSVTDNKNGTGVRSGGRQRSMSGNCMLSVATSFAQAKSFEGKSVSAAGGSGQKKDDIKSTSTTLHQPSNPGTNSSYNHRTVKQSSVLKSSPDRCNNKIGRTVSANCELSPIQEKRLSTGAFDTSLSDDILCQLAEPDEVLESQITGFVTNKKDTVASKTEPDNCGKKIPDRLAGKTVENSRRFKFKNLSQKPSSVSKCDDVCDNKVAKCDKKLTERELGGVTCSSVQEATVAKPLLSCSSTRSSKSSSVTSGVGTDKQTKSDAFPAYSEDLFLSDDDEMTEPQLLAMLDQVEATQHVAAHKNSDHSSNSQGSRSDGHSSQGHLSSQSQQDSQGQSSSQGQPNSQGQSSSQVLQGSQNKCSPLEIERKKQEALRRRKMKLSAQTKT